MAQNYAKGIALGNNGIPFHNSPPPVSVLGVYSSENATASSVITLTQDTTAVEIAAVGGPAVMRWVRTADTQASVVSAASGANFSHVIATGTVRRFIVPIETSPGASPTSSQMGANVANGLYARLAYKSIGIASVLTTEF